MPEIVPLSTSPVTPFSLSSPVRLLARPTLTVEPEDSLALASNRFLQNGSNFLPVISSGKLAGVITGNGLAVALGDAAEFSDAVKEYVEAAQTIPAYATGAEALRAFEQGAPLIVVDDDDRLVGVIAPADLYPKHRPRLRPPSVGGMATPLGVYLTSGTVTSGVSRYALILSGAALSLMILVSAVASHFIALWLYKHGLISSIAEDIEVACTPLIFCLLFRLLPLSGIHGAEHQVVHAIERELELTPNIVRRMGRYHPRCGTNYSVAFALFMGIYSVNWTSVELFRLLFAFTATLALWKPLGRFAQFYITTRKPSASQLNQAIRAGEELLDKYSTAKVTSFTPLNWFWNSGLPFVLLGMMSIALLASTFAYFIKVDFL